jgi:hypothetical protein
MWKAIGKEPELFGSIIGAIVFFGLIYLATLAELVRTA